MISKIKNAFIIIICGLCLYLFITLKIKERRLENLFSQNASLEQGLKRKITISDNKIIYKYRAAAQSGAQTNSKAKNTSEADNSTPAVQETQEIKEAQNAQTDTVIVKSYFLPAEGRAEILQTQQDEVKINLTDKGFTLRPFGGALYTKGGGDFFIGVRAFYFKRFGAGAAFAFKNGPAAAADRRLDDVLPLKNVSLVLLAGKDFIAAGAAVYF